MKVAWYEHNGEARDVLRLDEWPDPQPAAGEVRVRVASSGVNPSDVKSRPARAPAWPRVVPHSDGAGVIDAVGHPLRQDARNAGAHEVLDYSEADVAEQLREMTQGQGVDVIIDLDLLTIAELDGLLRADNLSMAVGACLPLGQMVAAPSRVSRPLST